jgi:hypothetical protein
LTGAVWEDAESDRGAQGKLAFAWINSARFCASRLPGFADGGKQNAAIFRPRRFGC